MMPDFTLANLTVQPGQIGFGVLTTAYLPDSTPVNVPLIVVNGAQPGPTLLLTAAMHGPEIPGCEVIRRITREVVDPAKLRGAIIALPIVNPFAFSNHSMGAPQDGYNMNRVFPGQENGMLTHRLAYQVFHKAVPLADAIIDFHANPTPAIMFSLYRNQPTDVGAKAAAMAEAYGITNIQLRLENESHRSGTMSDAAQALGKPALTIELLSWRRILEDSVRSGVRGTLNVMKHLGMLDGAPEPQNDVPVIPGKLSRVETTAAKGGLVHYLSDAGAAVKKGEVLARILNPYGDLMEEVPSPVDGWILAYALIHSQSVATGDFVNFIAYRI
jgi:predicted deacylase